MIEVRSLTAGYNDIVIIKDINLKFEKGEIVTILGPNGCGKTTLLRSIVGIIDAFDGKITKGDIFFNGQSIKNQQPHDLFREGIAFVPDGGKVFPSMTVKENLEMGGYILKEKSVVNQRIDNVLHLFPILKDLYKRKAGSLSGGERQILSLARSLISEPEYLILDEPTAGLSPNYMKILFRKLVELKKGKGILVVEQNAKLALKYSDRGYVIRHGELVMEDSAENLLNKEDVFKLL
jgi:branched-chain amino acid transport system ATP-binding protein